MSRIVRLSESDLNKFIKKVIKEDAMGAASARGIAGTVSKSAEGCPKETTRPSCSSFGPAKTIGGKMLPLEGEVFMQVMIDGCPKLCKVQGEIYKLV
jgi:hypothetical protein